MADAICQTSGCGNQGVPVSVPETTTDIDGNPIPVTLVVCGPCGQPITVEDLTDLAAG